ncbi:uncharacterized protein [Hetaerina americana]|uniref:uncharacterized protein n=1 Tax=Hetaerina americana TaxID=62018 RepID=UPI003A7F1E8A
MKREEELNYDCNLYILMVQTKLHQIRGQNDKARVMKWLKKLSSCQRNTEEMKSRNELMHYLLENIRERQLKPPFTEDPPQGPLPPLDVLLDKKSEHYPATDTCPDRGNATGAMQPLIYNFSPDGGAFLAAQPVPRCGAFCYLAVISREK